MERDSRYRIFEVAPQRVRDVADPRRTIGQPLQLGRRNAGRGHHPDPGEAGTTELTERFHFEIGETLAVLLRNMGDRQREARSHCGQQHLGWARPGVIAAFFDRFVDRQLELSDLYVTPVPAFPAGGNASHE